MEAEIEDEENPNMDYSINQLENSLILLLQKQPLDVNTNTCQKQSEENTETVFSISTSLCENQFLYLEVISPLKMMIVQKGESFGRLEFQRQIRDVSEDHHYPRNGSDCSSRNTNNRSRNQYISEPRDTDSGYG